MKMSNEVYSKVVDVIVKTLAIEKENVNFRSKVEDLCKDSIQIFSLIMAFEKEYGKKIEYDDIVKIETVGDIVEYVEKSVGK